MKTTCCLSFSVYFLEVIQGLFLKVYIIFVHVSLSNKYVQIYNMSTVLSNQTIKYEYPYHVLH